MASLTLPEFVATWQKSTLTERSASQTHFNGLCDILGEPKPAEADPDGSSYTFERGTSKIDGGDGWADVWKRDFFGWEYKGKRKNLDEAYRQLLQYREDLENPPLLITCDLDRFEVHTNFNNTATQIYKFDLAALEKNEPSAECPLPPLEVLRCAFTDPGKLKPGRTTEQVTEEAAAQFSQLAKSLRDRGIDPEKSAHFLMRLLFCLFSEDVGLLPGKLFSRLVNNSIGNPADFDRKLKLLFSAMSAPNGTFGADNIPYFNGGLFSDDQSYLLSTADLVILSKAASLNWANVEPAIFGTLFERSLDPSKRSQLGAHYTSKDDILLIVEPVVMAPLRRRWQQVRTEAEEISAKLDSSIRSARTKQKSKLRELLMGFADEVSKIKVLDPACGSGNFLYVALKSILDLEKQISNFAAQHGLSGLLPKTDPSQLYGIETNVYAHELASVVVWIGYIQWQHDNGMNFGSSPILKPLTNIHRMDAVLAYNKDGKPVEPEWPTADFIIGNPPFLGGNKIRQELGDTYVDGLFALYADRIPRFADLVCYWFERARVEIEKRQCKRVGLLATQGIRGGANRKVLEKIKQSGDIFWAQSDRDWILDGANVHVSMVGFDDGFEKSRYLDGENVAAINADLTADIDLTVALPLKENVGLCFMGPSAKAPFDVGSSVAQSMLTAPLNVNGRTNSDVVRPVCSGVDLVQHSRGQWTIDFGLMPESQAAEYELPFEYVRRVVYPVRMSGKRAKYAGNWWQYARPRHEMRTALSSVTRYIATPAVSKHRIFVWVKLEVLCNQGTLVFARDDDYFLGVLHSSVHELWARRKGTQVREAESGFRYTPQTTFETYPFPWPPGTEPEDDPGVNAIADAAKQLAQKRDAWLNPLGASATELKKRTLTNLYNQRPQWLNNLHNALDRAVLVAYGWSPEMPESEILRRLLELNLKRASSDLTLKRAAGIT